MVGRRNRDLEKTWADPEYLKQRHTTFVGGGFQNVLGKIDRLIHGRAIRTDHLYRQRWHDLTHGNRRRSPDRKGRRHGASTAHRTMRLRLRTNHLLIDGRKAR
jgi:hypothetical protein